MSQTRVAPGEYTRSTIFSMRAGKPGNTTPALRPDAFQASRQGSAQFRPRRGCVRGRRWVRGPDGGVGVPAAKVLWGLSEAGVQHVRETLAELRMIEEGHGWLDVSTIPDAGAVRARVALLGQ